jgi:hypothetical protein
MKKALFVFGFVLIAAVELIGTPDTSKWEDFASQEGNAWSVQFSENGTVKSFYGIGRTQVFSATDAAAKFLAQHSKMLGIQNASDLWLVTIDLSTSSIESDFCQHNPKT